MIDEEIEFEDAPATFIEYLEDEINYCKGVMDKKGYGSNDYWYWKGRVEALQLTKDTYKFYKK